MGKKRTQKNTLLQESEAVSESRLSREGTVVSERSLPQGSTEVSEGGSSQESTGMQTAINRTYKSRIFEMIFSDRRELLNLYNAVNNTDYKDPEQLEINTLKNAIYMAMRNDISFIVDMRLNLYEHQATYNPNLPLRFLFQWSGRTS